MGWRKEKNYTQPLPKIRLEKSGIVEKKVYVAPLFTDGDAAWAMTNQLDEKWSQPERGKIPMNWGFMPSLYQLGPGLLEYYETTRSDNDYFIAGPSGIGYTYPHMHKNPASFLTMTRTAMKRLDMRVANIVSWNPHLSFKGVTPAAFHHSMREALPDALGFVRGLGASVWESSSLDKEAPIVYSGIAIHRKKLIDPRKRLEDFINACPNRPLFIFMYVNHAISLAQLNEAFACQSHPVECLRLDEFMMKLHAAVDRGLITNELYPIKNHFGPLLVKEMKPEWKNILGQVYAMKDLENTTEEECLIFFNSRMGGCDPRDLRAAFQYDLCLNTLKMIRAACGIRGIYVGNQNQGVVDFFTVYPSVPNKRQYLSNCGMVVSMGPNRNSRI